MNILEIVKNQYWKESYRIIKDIEFNQQTEPGIQDTFIDSMYKEMKYKTLKDTMKARFCYRHTFL